MRTLITLCSLLAAIALGWQYTILTDEKKTRDARLIELAEESKTVQHEWTRQISEKNAQIEAANAQIAKLEGRPIPTPKPNWIEDRNKAWKSSLSAPASDNRRVIITTPYIYPVPPPPVTPTPPAFRLR